MKAVLLDRALLVTLAVDHSNLPYVFAAIKNGRAYYEARGMSAIETSLRALPELGSRLVAVSTELELDVDTTRRISDFLDACFDDPEVTRELDVLHRAASLPASRARETLAYAARLILLAQRRDAAIVLWPKRAPLLLKLLSGLPGEHSECDGLRLQTVDVSGHPLGIGGNHRLEIILGPTDALVAAAGPRARVFISYAHADNDSLDPNRRYVDRLLTHLRVGPLANQRAIWSDSDIETGGLWNQRIHDAIASAEAAVLVVSPSFLASRYISEDEMPLILGRMHGGALAVFPMLLRPCSVDRAVYDYIDPRDGPSRLKLSELQFANPIDRPFNALSESQQDALLTKVAQQVFERVTSPSQS